jgi:hypothetical protein
MLKILKLKKGINMNKKTIMLLTAMISTNISAMEYQKVPECMPVELKLEVLDSKNNEKTREIILTGCEEGINSSLSYLDSSTHYYSLVKPSNSNMLSKVVEGFSVSATFYPETLMLSISNDTLEGIKTEVVGNFKYQTPQIKTRHFDSTIKKVYDKEILIHKTNNESYIIKITKK